jgi:hypothetical protein
VFSAYRKHTQKTSLRETNLVVKKKVRKENKDLLFCIRGLFNVNCPDENLPWDQVFPAIATGSQAKG